MGIAMLVYMTVVHGMVVYENDWQEDAFFVCM